MSAVVWQLNLKEINITLIELWSCVNVSYKHMHFIKTTERNKASNMEDVAVKNTKNTSFISFFILK